MAHMAIGKAEVSCLNDEVPPPLNVKVLPFIFIVNAPPPSYLRYHGWLKSLNLLAGTR